MPIQFDNLPNSRPQTEVETGRVILTVEEVTAGRTQDGQFDSLKVLFKTPSGRNIYETFVDNPAKPFLMYKLGRLLYGLDIKLPGATIGMGDLVKLIKKGNKVEADITKNDRGYGQVSFDKGSEGFYPLNASTPVAPAKTEAAPTPTLDSNLSDILASDDETY